MSMDISHLGLSPEARTFLKNNKAISIGRFVMDCDPICGAVYGTIYQIHKEDKFDENCPCMPEDRYVTYAEVVDRTNCLYGNITYVYSALRDINTGELLFRWKENELMQEN